MLTPPDLRKSRWQKYLSWKLTNKPSKHEQANAVIEADGGAIGVTEYPSALRRWMVAGPEVSQLVAHYEI